MTDDLVYPALSDIDGRRVSRSPWGPDDEIGRLNWMTPATQAAVLARVGAAAPFDLAVDYFMGMPGWLAAGDPKYDIWMTHTPRGSVTDGVAGVETSALERYSYAGSAVTMYSHTGTHLCALNHIGHDGRFWNGLLRLVLAKPLKARMFPKRKEARRVRLVVERGTPLADLREQIEASEVSLERIVVRPNSADSEEDNAELVFAKGSGQEDLLSLMDELRRVSGVREVSSVLANGSAESKPNP